MRKKKKKITKVEDAIKEYNKKQRQNIVREHNTISHNMHSKSVINSKAVIYETTTKSIDGKRPDKRTCIYYDKSDGRCTNKNCSKSYCTTSHNCTGYKRRDKNKINNDIQYNDSLSEYDRSYLQTPSQSGTHERTNEYIAVSRHVGTPMHVGYLKSNDKRRHKSRCIYYKKLTKFCVFYNRQCGGSNRCEIYREK